MGPGPVKYDSEDQLELRSDTHIQAVVQNSLNVLLLCAVAVFYTSASVDLLRL